ncbi:response regulator transcription factor [Geodermatophilus sp. TF02-6]|uniref:LuxR C-terminal-related transcriptional regulator n=1 Tax=Geodermatophilus sp. TF02-6 TaxID=2250575 RepID=UPI001F29F30C|nr:response regulator transcription factor [Geodermatophilus sp. TF02-6]
MCDDSEVFRFGLRTVLRSAPDLVLVAEAPDSSRALALADEHVPHVALVGHDTPGNGALQLVRELSTGGVKVILLSETGTRADLVAALTAGACGFYVRSVSPARLVEAVRAVVRGETRLDEHLLNNLDEPTVPATGERPTPETRLTARQQAVAALVAQGLTNSEIAASLHLSQATVKGHITVVLRRLGLRDRTQLAIHVNRGRPGGRPPPRVGPAPPMTV